MKTLMFVIGSLWLLFVVACGHVRPPREYRGLLYHKVAAAKKLGQKTLELRTTSGEMPVVRSAEEALARSTVVLAVPTASQTQVEPRTEEIDRS